MGNPISDYLKQRVKELHQLGYNNRKIARLCKVSDAVVYYQIHGREKRKKETKPRSEYQHWQEDHVKYLTDHYGKQSTISIARHIGKDVQTVYNKAQELSLKIYNPDPPKERIRRQPPVYTNSRTPYGLADIIHAGNRIFI